MSQHLDTTTNVENIRHRFQIMQHPAASRDFDRSYLSQVELVVDEFMVLALVVVASSYDHIDSHHTEDEYVENRRTHQLLWTKGKRCSEMHKTSMLS